MKPTSILRLLPVACLFLLSVGLRSQEISRATITESVRDVQYRSQEDLDRIIPAETGLEIRGRDILTTGALSRAELLFDNEMLTRIGSNSIFSFEPEERILELEEGLALVRVPKGTREGIRMRTPTATAAITGTTVMFSVQPTPDDEDRRILKLAVLEGEIRITYPDGQELRLTAGQMAISSEGDQSPPEPVDFDLERLTRTSGLIHDFENDLGSETLIESAAARQNRAKRAGILQETGLIIRDAGTEVEIAGDDRDAFTSKGSRETNARRAREEDPNVENGGDGDSDNGETSETGFFTGAMTLEDAGDESGESIFTTEEQSLRSSLFTLEAANETAPDSAQAISGFDAVQMSGTLDVIAPLPDRFLFVADGEQSQPAFVIDNLHTRLTDGVLPHEPDGSSPFLGFLALQGGMEIRGENLFEDLGDTIFATFGGTLEVDGSIRARNGIGGEAYRGGSLNLFNERDPLIVRGTLDASGEGDSEQAMGGFIFLDGLSGITLEADSVLDASMSDSPGLLFSPDGNPDPQEGSISIFAPNGGVDMRGRVEARGGKAESSGEFSIFISAFDGITHAPTAITDVSAFTREREDPFAPANGGTLIFQSSGNDVISGTLRANADFSREDAQAGNIWFLSAFDATGERQILFDSARIEATGGAGGNVTVGLPDSGEPTNPDTFLPDTVLRSSTVDVSGQSSVGSTVYSDPLIDILGNSVEIDDAVLTANGAAAMDPEGGPRIQVNARNNLVIHNSSQLAALINGGDSPGGTIHLESGSGDINVGRDTGGEIDANLEAASINVIGTRSIAFVNSRLRAWQGNIHLETSRDGSIQIDRTSLRANSQIFVRGGTVTVNDSDLTANLIDLLRDNGNFADRAGAGDAGNVIEGELQIRDYDGNPLDGQ